MPGSDASRQRLFIAIPCPLTPAISSALDELRAAQRDPASGLRVVSADTLHITLSFPGSVPAERVADVHEAMAQLRILPAPQLAIRGAGHFSSALWLGVEQPEGGTSAALDAIAQRCESELRARGFELECRPFHPHVTVARRRNGGHFDCTAWCERHRDTAWTAFTADAVHLYRSETRDNGSRYSVIHSVALR
ncbi:MAG: RNA 2',3'-cyclic phosphodiesterase [Pseudomonadota bacterium]|nr:RNA 2',3'-cyclic phosphodiesterase [Pseudomonadota bacterium]